MPPPSRGPTPEAPARGVFPLDHHGACKDAMRTFLRCLDASRAADDNVAAAHGDCRLLSRAYLTCRMDRGLMAVEDLNTLGFAPVVASAAAPATPAPAPPARSESVEMVAGLTSARRAKMGILFGLGSQAERKSAASH
jgi:cytochrome c oxidase assembly protein subunit 19